MCDSRLALWDLQLPSEIFILTLASASVLALAVLYCFLPPSRSGQERIECPAASDTTGPTVVQDPQTALYHMVKFSIRLKRKLKKIREHKHSNQSVVNGRLPVEIKS